MRQGFGSTSVVKADRFGNISHFDYTHCLESYNAIGGQKVVNLIIQFDYNLFATVNKLAGRWWWLDTPARLFLNDYFVPTVMALALLMLWFEGIDPARRAINQRAVLVGSLSAALANILLKIVNLLYYRPRPFDMLEAHLLFYHPTDSSMPSNAAALGFSIAAGVWLYRRRWGGPLLATAAVFGLSRIFGGVHYPLDVLSGAAIGCVSAWVVQQQTVLVDRSLSAIIWLTQKLGLP